MDTIVIPPASRFIPSQITDLITEMAATAEKAGQLHPGQLDIIYKQKWFNLFVPREYGGSALSLPEGLRIEECLAWADGSTGWTVTLCSGAGWFIGFLDPALAKEAFKNGHVCFAGSGQATGIAKHTATGYEISGYWNYASGASHATVFTANCMIEKDGILLRKEDGNALVRPFLFFKEEVILHKKWHTIGMIATGSDGFEVRRLQVSHNRCFIIDSRNVVLKDAIYQYPFLQFAEATLAVNSSGMAARFFHLCEILWKGNEKYNDRKTVAGQSVFEYLQHIQTQLGEARQSFYSAVQHSWEELVLNRSIPAEVLAIVSKQSRNLAATARRIVDDAYPYCGLTAADPDTEINRVWRNLHTASQHSLLAFEI